MAIIDISSQPQFREIVRRIHALENASPMNNAAVGRSGFEVYDGGTIDVTSGNIVGAGTFSWQGSFSQSGTSVLSGSTTIAGPTGITGQLTIQGATSVTGPLTVTGDTKLNGKTDVGGAFTVTGDTKLNGKTDVGGNTKITGTLDVTGGTKLGGATEITGVTTLKSDLNVEGSGKINVGQLQIEPANGGQINWTGGGLSASPTFGTLLVADRLLIASAESMTLTSVKNTINGNTFFENAVRFNNATAFFPALPTTSAAPNLFISASGQMYKTSWTP